MRVLRPRATTRNARDASRPPSRAEAPHVLRSAPSGLDLSLDSGHSPQAATIKDTNEPEDEEDLEGANQMAQTKEKFRVTYATMKADNEELQSAYDRGIDVAKSWLGKRHPF